MESKKQQEALERTISLISQRKDLVVVSGDDAIDFSMLANGAKGIISVTANLLPNLKSQLLIVYLKQILIKLDK